MLYDFEIIKERVIKGTDKIKKTKSPDPDDFCPCVPEKAMNISPETRARSALIQV